MFELPEFVTLARQINETLTGRTISAGAWAAATQFAVQPHPKLTTLKPAIAWQAAKVDTVDP